MRLDFTKMHGLGNDFIVFDAADRGATLAPDLLRRLSDRRRGIGFDQALVLEPPRRAMRQWRTLHRAPGREPTPHRQRESDGCAGQVARDA